jgi:hypothetical protein
MMIQDHHHQLYTHLKSFQSVQACYMPQVIHLLQEKPGNNAPDTIENTILFLPHQIPSGQ